MSWVSYSSWVYNDLIFLFLFHYEHFLVRLGFTPTNKPLLISNLGNLAFMILFRFFWNLYFYFLYFRYSSTLVYDSMGRFLGNTFLFCRFITAIYFIAWIVLTWKGMQQFYNMGNFFFLFFLQITYVILWQRLCVSLLMFVKLDCDIE